MAFKKIVTLKNQISLLIFIPIIIVLFILSITIPGYINKSNESRNYANIIEFSNINTNLSLNVINIENDTILLFLNPTNTELQNKTIININNTIDSLIKIKHNTHNIQIVKDYKKQLSQLVIILQNTKLNILNNTLSNNITGIVNSFQSIISQREDPCRISSGYYNSNNQYGCIITNLFYNLYYNLYIHNMLYILYASFNIQKNNTIENILSIISGQANGNVSIDRLINNYLDYTSMLNAINIYNTKHYNITKPKIILNNTLYNIIHNPLRANFESKISPSLYKMLAQLGDTNNNLLQNEDELKKYTSQAITDQQSIFNIYNKISNLVFQATTFEYNRQYNNINKTLIISSLVFVNIITVLLYIRNYLINSIDKIKNYLYNFTYNTLPNIVQKIHVFKDKKDITEYLSQNTKPLDIKTSNLDINEFISICNILPKKIIDILIINIFLTEKLKDILHTTNKKIQDIINEQLTYIEILEQDENITKESLKHVFAIDNTNARINRYIENILLLSDHKDSNKELNINAALISDIIKFSISETSEYARVFIKTINNDLLIHGNIVNNLTHIIAELIDNALIYTDKHLFVTINGYYDIDNKQYCLEIINNETNLTEKRLKELNKFFEQSEQQHDRTTLLLSEYEDIGLKVVLLLSTIHNIKIQLQQNNMKGTITKILIPEEIIYENTTKTEDTKTTDINAKEKNNIELIDNHNIQNNKETEKTSESTSTDTEKIHITEYNDSMDSTSYIPIKSNTHNNDKNNNIELYNKETKNTIDKKQEENNINEEIDHLINTLDSTLVYKNLITKQEYHKMFNITEKEEKIDDKNLSILSDQNTDNNDKHIRSNKLPKRIKNNKTTENKEENTQKNHQNKIIKDPDYKGLYQFYNATKKNKDDSEDQ